MGKGSTQEPAENAGGAPEAEEPEDSDSGEEPVIGFLGETKAESKKKKKESKTGKKDSKKKKKDGKKKKSKKDKKKKKSRVRPQAVPPAYPIPRRQFFG